MSCCCKNKKSERTFSLSTWWSMGVFSFLSLLALGSCGGSEPHDRTAKSILLRETRVELIEGEIFELVATVDPQGAKVQFSSSDAKIAHVDEKGFVYALKEGKCVISVSSGELKKECEILVERVDNSKTFDRLPLPPVQLFGANDEALVQKWESTHGGTLEPRLSGYDEARTADVWAFNVSGDETVKLRIYYITKDPKKGNILKEIGVYTSPVDHVFEIQAGKARMNRSFRKLMTREGFFLSHITTLGASYVNPAKGLGVIISPAEHPTLGLLALFNYKLI